MLSWTGNDQSMKMRETSRVVDKKLRVNNYLKKKAEILNPALDELSERMRKRDVPENVITHIVESIRPFAGWFTPLLLVMADRKHSELLGNPKVLLPQRNWKQ